MMCIGTLALTGFPFFAGYFSKDAIIESAYASQNPLSTYAYILTVAAAALTSYASTDPNDTASLYPIVQKLEKIMSTDVPYAPLLYGADWNVYSSAKYTGWPNQSHPYMNPSPSDPQMAYILMQLKPVS